MSFHLNGLSTNEMAETNFDFLIVGQGLAGTFLSNYLLAAGKRVAVIDNNNPFSASKVASGVINPVTGRRIVRTWMIEELLPFALEQYSRFGRELGISLVKQCSVLDFHPSRQMREAFETRLTEERQYLHSVDKSFWSSYFNFHFGVGKINPCLLIDVNLMLAAWRKELQEKGILIEETFDINKLSVERTHITYQNLVANQIIFCDGVNSVTNPYFKNLPFSPNKGEAVIARIPNLSSDYIYKQGLSIVPWKDDLFWVGSSYDWNFSDVFPSASFKAKVESFLVNFLKIPFQIVDHIASVRPANMERRPFVGLHPTVSNVGILNGLGTKGCSLAPFFARQLADLLLIEKPILAEADVKRFERILARRMN